MKSAPSRHPSGPWELAAASQLTLFVIGVTWAFGGNADWVRTPISLWGTVGILITVAGAATPRVRRGMPAGTLAWSWPVLALNVMVALSCLTPGFKVLSYPAGSYLMPVHVAAWIPSSARASLSLRSLWLFDGIYFSCLNLALFVKRRKTLRVVLAAVVGNAVVLSVFGTVQKLVGSPGIYFGAVHSPQESFFASFVYDNHWSAFTLLNLGLCLGLVVRYVHGARGGGFFTGPAPAGVIAAAILGLTIPFSGARACSALMVVLLAVLLARSLPSLLRTSRGWMPVAATGAALLAAGLGAWLVAGRVIAARALKTREQVAVMVAQRGLGARSVLYRDTWNMARERPAFGWGMGTFPIVFGLYNTQEAKGDHIPVVYHDAHSDWLQSVAEVGLVGTLLLGAAVALPLAATRRRRLGPVPFYPLLACGLVAAYAWVEFPFGNVGVVLTWWLCLVASVHYVRLSDARPPRPVPA